MITTQEVMAAFDKTLLMLRDNVETHNGWLLQRALHALKEEGVIVNKANYTAVGVEAELYFPTDKKTYRLTLQEDRHSK